MKILFALGPGPAPARMLLSVSRPCLRRISAAPLSATPGALLPAHPILLGSLPPGGGGGVLGSCENMYCLKGQAGTEHASFGMSLSKARYLCCWFPPSRAIQNRKLIQVPVSCLDRMLGSQSGGRGVGQGVTVESERQGSAEPWRQGEVGEWHCPYVGAVMGGPLLQRHGAKGELCHR